MEGKWSLSYIAHFIPGETDPGTRKTGDWVHQGQSGEFWRREISLAFVGI
jgi:hypothetical protein